MEINITISKTHIAILSVAVLAASASATVDVKDTMNVFGDIEIIDGDVSARDQNENPANVSLTSPIDMQNNNIYNIGNLGSEENGGKRRL